MANTRRCAGCSRSRPTITAVVSTTDLIEATRRVALVAERNSAVRLAFSEGEVVLDAGHTRRRPSVRGHRGDGRGRRHHRRLQPGVPAGRSQCARRAVRATGLHAGHQARGLRRTRQARRHHRVGVPLPLGAHPYRWLAIDAHHPPDSHRLPLLRSRPDRAGSRRHHAGRSQRPRQDQRGRGDSLSVDLVVTSRRNRRADAAVGRPAGGHLGSGRTRRTSADA